jgi:hypothetical protein
MKSIYKYPLLAYVDRQQVQLPVGAEIVHVEQQNGVPTLWALVTSDPLWPTEFRTILFVGTGHTLPGEHHDHIGSYTEGPFVWHVLELL